jgi:L-asparagine transporter-like permease
MKPRQCRIWAFALLPARETVVHSPEADVAGTATLSRHGPRNDTLIVEKPVYAVALLVVILSLLSELLVPGADRFVAIAAVTCGVATWVAPLLVLAISWNQKPRTSLAGVGFTIRLFVVAACFSAAGIWLALLTLVFAQDRTYAWIVLLLIGIFWLWVAVMLVVGDRRRKPGQDGTRARPKKRLRRRLKKRTE